MSNDRDDRRRRHEESEPLASPSAATIPRTAAERRRQAQRDAAAAAVARITAAPAPPREAAQSRPAGEPDAGPKRLPPFPDSLIHAGDDLPIEPADLATLLAAPYPDGPRLVGPFVRRVAGVKVGSESFLVFIERNHILGWTSAKELPRGGHRRGDWLLFSDGAELQVLRDRPHDAEAWKSRRDEPVDRLAERRAEAAQELDRDIEHFVAAGLSIEEARRRVEQVHQEELELLVVGTFIVMAGATPAEAPIEGLGRAAGSALAKATATAPEATSAQRLLAAILGRSEDVVREFPHLGRLPPTADNLAGMQRLVDLFDDAHLPPELRAQFLEQVKARVGKQETPPNELLVEMKKVAYEHPDLYLRKGARTDAATITKLGGLRRAIPLKSVLFNLTNDRFYQKARRVDPSLPENRVESEWRVDAPKLVSAVRSGRLPFNAAIDLRPDALVQGYRDGASGWYFAQIDAGDAVAKPSTLHSKLAVGPDYLDGYLIVDLPADVALKNGAARPTAIDLTLMPEGKLNPKTTEPFGRTNPQAPGQKSVRELVLPPLPLSVMSGVVYVPAE